MTTSTDSNEAPAEYADDAIAFLEILWGEGRLSPGGPDELRAVLEGFDLTGCSVLDFGCGAGGVSVSLAAEFGAARVTGIDVEAPALERARQVAQDHGVAERVGFQRVAPGPLPFADASFDVFFSRDAIIHIADKEGVFADAYRVLKPGGWLIGSDWLIGHDGEPSPAMQRYLALEGHSFHMGSPTTYRDALEAAGFEAIELRDRNPWYRERAQAELEAMRGPLYERACAAAGRERVRHNIATWEAMIEVLASGEHRPHHLRARKPV